MCKSIRMIMVLGFFVLPIANASGSVPGLASEETRAIDGPGGGITDTLGSTFIDVIFPHADTVLYHTQITGIRWEKSRDLDDQYMKIELVNKEDNSQSIFLTECTVNTGGWTWGGVSADIEPGLYTIHVMTTDEQYEDYSDAFEIKLFSDYPFGVTDPDASSVWRHGEEVGIKLNAEKFIEDGWIYQASIVLINLFGVERMIAAHARVDREFSWLVPYDLAAGGYYLKCQRVRHIPGGPIVPIGQPFYSGEFAITGREEALTVRPFDSEYLEPGAQYSIQWDTTGVTDTHVKIRLIWNLYGETSVELEKHTIMKITDEAENCGNYLWMVPYYIPDGTYCIRVQTTNSNVGGDGDYFKVVAREGLKVTMPIGGSKWQQGAVETIKWSSRGPMDDMVKIQLVKRIGGAEQVSSISPATENSGEFPWTVPADLEPGNYLVRISDLRDQFSDDGDLFLIESDNPGLTLTSPGFSTVLSHGEEKVVRWTSTGEVYGQVALWLMRDTGGIREVVDTISSSTENDEEFTWRVPESIEPGERYLIRIATTDDPPGQGFTDDGDLFEIASGPGLVWWSIGDTHVDTETPCGSSYPDLNAFHDVLRDAGGEADEGGEGFVWDLATLVGDYVAGDDIPLQRGGAQWRAQYLGTGYLPSQFYGVLGNHDAGAGDNLWFRQYIDPLAEFSEISGVYEKERPYPVTGAFDHYAFTAGNVLFLMLGDRNEGPEPFGRVNPETDHSFPGHPSGRMTRATLDWWEEMVAANQNKIIVTVSHHAPANTTVHTGLRESFMNRMDNNVIINYAYSSWADGQGGTMLYAIDDKVEDYTTIGIDGCMDKNKSCVKEGERDYGFLKYLEEHPGAIDFWIHGHDHSTVGPAVYRNGKSDVEKKFGVWFINIGAVTRSHSPTQVIYSRVFQFFDNESRVIMKTYLHSADLLYVGKHYWDWIVQTNGWTETQEEGFFDPIQRTFFLEKVYHE